MHKIAMLGTGLIGMFYTKTLHGQRGRDRVHTVYSRSAERAETFAKEWSIPKWTTDISAAIQDPDVDVVVVGVPNNMHEVAVTLAAEAGKSVLCMLLAGFVVPSEGEIDFAGQPLHPPLHARALGIEVILETPSLADDLDVSGNIFLGSESSWPPILKWFQVPNRQRMDQEAARILRQLELDIPLKVDTKSGDNWGDME